MKKLKNGWKRDYSEESGAVIRWYEKGNITASLVEGEFPNELQWRISGDNPFISIESRGDKKIMEKKSDSQNIEIIETLIRREKYNT